MIKTTNITKHNLVRMPDILRYAVIETNKTDKATVDVYFGANMDIMVVVAKNKKLSNDNQQRIKILTEEK
jgi:hypothetical protein